MFTVPLAESSAVVGHAGYWLMSASVVVVVVAAAVVVVSPATVDGAAVVGAAVVEGAAVVAGGAVVGVLPASVIEFFPELHAASSAIPASPAISRFIL